MYIDSKSEHDATDKYERIFIVQALRQVEMISRCFYVWYNIGYIFEFTWIGFYIYFWNIKVKCIHRTNVSFQAEDWIMINVLSLMGYLMIKISIVKPLKSLNASISGVRKNVSDNILSSKRCGLGIFLNLL